MQGRFGEPCISEHLLILSKSISVAGVRAGKHHHAESRRHGRRHTVLVRNKFQGNGLSAGFQSRMNATYQFFASGCIEVVEYVRQQHVIISVAKLDVERTARPRCSGPPRRISLHSPSLLPEPRASPRPLSARWDCSSPR